MKPKIIPSVSEFISSLFSLEGQVALVTGAGRGVGRSVALSFAAAGADLVLASRSKPELEEAAEEVINLGRRALAVQTDVTDEEEVKRLVERGKSEFGRIDVVLNGAGVVSLMPTTEFPLDQWQHILDVNLKGTFLVCRSVAPIMIAQRRGKIINMSSVRGLQGRSRDAAYAPSKGAVNQLTRSLACEWAQYGVCVNAIAPTFMETGLSSPLLADPEVKAWVLSRIPMGRLGTPEDLHGAAIFLASKASDFVTGHILYVDGGWTAA